MTQDVRQWLAEIKALQQAVAVAQKERDEAYQGAANWRKLYETEAQQRRTDTRLAQEKIAELEAEIQQLKGNMDMPELDANQQENLRQHIAHLQSPEAFQNELIAVMAERDSLRQQLKQEQAAHEKTRNDLISALGDTMDRLARQQGTHAHAAAQNQDGSSHPPAESATADGQHTKTPSLELPPTHPAQSHA
jgi:DNA-binding helix-hairpin-helix protein with protein kinase domain